MNGMSANDADADERLSCDGDSTMSGSMNSEPWENQYD